MVLEHGRNYNHHMHEHVKSLDFKDRLLNEDEWQAKLLGQDWNIDLLAAEIHLERAKEEYEEAIDDSYYLIYLSIALVFIVLIVYVRGPNLIKAMAGALVAVSVMCLYVGIYTPMLEIHAFSEDLEIPIDLDLHDFAISFDNTVSDGIDYLNEYTGGYINLESLKTNLKESLDDQLIGTVKFEGRMYYFHQSKSITKVISILMEDKNFVVAWALLCFSVILPLLKLVLTMLITFVAPVRKWKPLLVIVKIIGKWSMADVMVVSMFLAFLSFSNLSVGIETESKVLFGLYFFLAYVIISIWSAIFIWLAIRKENNVALYELAI